MKEPTYNVLVVGTDRAFFICADMEVPEGDKDTLAFLESVRDNITEFTITIGELMRDGNDAPYFPLHVIDNDTGERIDERVVDEFFDLVYELADEEMLIFEETDTDDVPLYTGGLECLNSSPVKE